MPCSARPHLGQCLRVRNGRDATPRDDGTSRTTQGRSRLELTDREHDVAVLSAKGYSNPEKAADVFNSREDRGYHRERGLESSASYLRVERRGELCDARPLDCLRRQVQQMRWTCVVASLVFVSVRVPTVEWKRPTPQLRENARRTRIPTLTLARWFSSVQSARTLEGILRRSRNRVRQPYSTFRHLRASQRPRGGQAT